MSQNCHLLLLLYLMYYHNHKRIDQIVLSVTAFCYPSRYLPIMANKPQVSHIHRK